MADLIERLRDVGCDREPFSPEHAKCICRLTNEAADQIERLRGLIADERIECAKIAEEYNGDGIEIADLIRKRPVVTY